MYGALLYLRVASLWNLVVSRVRRLRQPKYLFGALAGAAYLYLFFWRRFMGTPVPALPHSPEVAGAVAAGGAALAAGFAVVRIGLAWLAPIGRSGLRFSEAEIAFLFPAPISRRMLVHYRLLSAQVGLLLSALVLALLLQRFGAVGANLPLRLAGAWIMAAMLHLHLTGVALSLTRLRERGAHLRRWRAVIVGLLGLYAAALVVAALTFRPGPAAQGVPGVQGGLAYLEAALNSGPLNRLLLPFRIATAPLLAAGGRAFAHALPAALGLLALHYLWVMRSQAAFAEGSIAAAERRSARAAGRRTRLGEGAGAVGPNRPRAAAVPRGEPFRLARVGRPEVAFLWKNLLSMQNALTDRRVLRLGLWVVAGLLLGLRALLISRARSGQADLAPVVAGLAAMVAGYTLLLGPQLARQDLRSDLPNIDLLKTYPLAGWQIALGELLAPTAILTVLLWFTILAPAVALDARSASWLTPGLRLTGAGCLAALAPVACLLQLLVPNALMIAFPGWHQAAQVRSGGVEIMGQRMIFVFLQFIVALLALLPAALAAAVMIFASQWLIGGAAAMMLGTAAALAILGGEAVVGVWWLGTCLERFDLSSETRP
jgi:hypothetical protein